MSCPDPAALEALERRFSGPVPRALRDALAAAPAEVIRRRAAARAAALSRFAAEARAAACALRSGRHLSEDLRLRLAGPAERLAWARERAEGWRRHAEARSP